MGENRQWTAKHRYARVSARKARLIAGVIRGRRCADALEQLRFFKQRSVIMVRNVLKSAMTNADEGEADMQRLFVSEARVDGGPYYRRFRPKDRGRAHPIAKKTSHIIVTVAER